jgi:hypothetical protein
VVCADRQHARRHHSEPARPEEDDRGHRAGEGVDPGGHTDVPPAPAEEGGATAAEVTAICRLRCRAAARRSLSCLPKHTGCVPLPGLRAHGDFACCE